MKFKIYHFLIVYEVATFIHEMYKRKANCVRFELQESVGKVNIYIDDSSFKQIDGSIAWRIVKSMYYYIAKKDNNKGDFDKDKDFEGTLNNDDFKKFKFNMLPLPKGKCLSYSYITKPGNIYEVSFSLASNNVGDLIKELVMEKNSLNATNDMVYVESINNDNEDVKTYELEGITYKNERLRVFLGDDDNDDPVIRTFKGEDIDTKKKIKSIFDRMKFKDNGSDPVIEDSEKSIKTDTPTKITW